MRVVEFRVLGAFEVVDGDRPLALGGPKQRALLAMLLLHRGEVVSTDRLIDALWGERASATAAKTVQVYVSSLRKALGDGLLVTRGRGYLLQAEAGQRRCRPLRGARGWRAARRSQAGDRCGRRSSGCDEALGLWRGPPLADFAYESFARGGDRAAWRRRAWRRSRIELTRELALGEHARLVGELEGLVREHPLRERLQAQLMLALYRCGRQADALESYRSAPVVGR